MKTRTWLAVHLLVVAAALPARAEGELHRANLGDFRLESGEIIRDCQIGYRTLGRLDADGSNAVLFPTWFSGTTENLLDHVGPGKLVDATRYYVILVDALGDGVSSSPSNSPTQPRMKFPRFTIRDMVNSQHELLTRVLKIHHLRAVMGLSMGGMQTFQWIVSYPEFVDMAIPIVGTTRQTSFDLLLWRAEESALESDPAWNHGEYTAPPAAGLKAVAHLHAMCLSTPEYRVANTSPSEFPQFLESTEQERVNGFDANNWIRQLQAMMSHDIAASFGGSMEKAAAAIRARVFVVVASQDHMVNPRPALELASLLVAPTLELKSNCGHLAPICERPLLSSAIARFLAR
jgi:homoserine O-acetyltransferase